MTLRFSRYGIRTMPCVLFGLFTFFSAQAETVVCDNCDQATMQTEAISQGIGAHYVVDIVNNVVRKFEVSGKCSVDRETGGTECWGTSAIEQSVEASIINYVGVAHKLSKAGVIVPAGGPVNVNSAYNALTTPSGRSFVQGVVNATIRLEMPPSFSPLTTVTAHFSDGSTAVYELNPYSHQWELQPNSARDAQGNPVVIEASDFTDENGGPQTFDYGWGGRDASSQAGRDFSNFLDAARRAGVPIVGAPGSRLRLVCIGVSGVYTCRYVGI
jgi:hypothetical protein